MARSSSFTLTTRRFSGALTVMALGIAGALCGTPVARATPINLLTNPGAEQGTGNAPAGWTAGGDSSPVRDDGSFDSGLNPHSGTYQFLGGSGAAGSFTQSVDALSGGFSAGQIDAGGLFANVDFYEQSLQQGPPNDAAGVSLTFLNASAAPLGTVQTAMIDSGESWQEVSGSFPIPTGTRAIAYAMLFSRNVGSDLDSFIDDNVLTIGAQTPEPTALGLFGVGGLGLLGRRRRR